MFLQKMFFPSHLHLSEKERTYFLVMLFGMGAIVPIVIGSVCPPVGAVFIVLFLGLCFLWEYVLGGTLGGTMVVVAVPLAVVTFYMISLGFTLLVLHRAKKGQVYY